MATVRARLLSLQLVAIAPVVAMAAFMAIRARDMAIERARDRAAGELATALERVQSNLRRGEDIAELLSTMPAVSLGGDACHALLANTRARFADLLAGLSVHGTDGSMRCADIDDPSGAPVLDPRTLVHGQRDRAERDRHWFSVAPAASLGAGPPTLTVAFPLMTGDAVTGILAAWLRIDGSSAAFAWIRGENDAVVAIGSASSATDALPAPGDVAVVFGSATGGIRRVASRAGPVFHYASGVLSGGAVLTVGVPAADDLGRAESLLGEQLAQLGLFLLAAMLALALGGDAALVRPIRRLSRAVRAWRAGGQYDDMATATTPLEIAELSTTFRQATEALRGREDELRQARTRQELLMQEVHHRVKNNLQIVASLLNLQASRIRQPAARAEFQAARDRIRALATLHRHLYAHGELHTIDMRGFLTELCDQLLLALGETPDGGRIRFGIEAPELRISSDQAVPIALIVTEVVSNAAKYAFPGGRSGHIDVRLEHLPRAPDQVERIRLSIQDDGIGIPAGRAETEDGVRDGIGLQLIRGFARQLRATLEVTEDHGTRYTLDMPLQGTAAPDVALEAEGGRD